MAVRVAAAALTTMRLVRLLCWNGLVLVIGLAVLELLFGAWLRAEPMSLLHLTRNGVWRFTVDYPGIEPADRSVVYRRDRWGLRGHYGSPEDIDLLTVGGSTTDQRFITEGATWQDVLQEHFRAAGRDIRVANAGVSGRTTFGHLQDFQHWFPRIPGLRPRYILFFVGINDMFFDRPNDTWDQVRRSGGDNLRQLLKDRSALYHLYRTSIGALLARRYNLTHTTLDFERGHWVARPLRQDYEQVLQPRLAAYRERLQALAGQVAALGATPIYVTQSRGDYYFRNGEVAGLAETRSRITGVHHDDILGPLGQGTANGVDYFLMLSLFNQALLEVCREVRGVCVDLATELRFEVGDFYDHVHNTRRGAEKIGRFLYRALRQYF